MFRQRSGNRGQALPQVGPILEIEGKTGVFVPEGEQGHTFAFRPCILGRHSDNRQEILSGLSEGETVVSKDAFMLKSELILQNEADED